MMIQVIGVKGIPIVRPNDDLAELICKAVKEQGLSIKDGDVVVVTQRVVSKSEGRIVHLKDVKPSPFAKTLAKLTDKPPELVEVILRESKSIRRVGHGVIIAETHHGWVCANAGIDISNVSGGNHVTTLPKDPDASARRIRQRIRELTGKDVAVIVSDTFGRPFREGVTDVAVGCAGLEPIHDRRGERDLFGYELRVKQVAVADELASAAELVIGQAAEGVPAAIVRGYAYRKSETATSASLRMVREKDLFL
jgi:coenzyme F420-0:L-glutamate ligase/coenzyme F420-1:gamma-L-glutamate ligase